MLEDKTIARLVLRSFQENLIQRLGPDEGRALNVLGKDFFYLVDQLATKLFEQHEKDAPLLDLMGTSGFRKSIFTRMCSIFPAVDSFLSGFKKKTRGFRV